jgi:hypothetical protein
MISEIVHASVSESLQLNVVVSADRLEISFLFSPHLQALKGIPIIYPATVSVLVGLRIIMLL